jgi:hypothetical protein
MKSDDEKPKTESPENTQRKKPLTATFEKVNQIMGTIPQQYRDDWKWIVYFYAKSTDEQFSDIINDLPVQDVQAIDTRMIKGKYFAEFITVMKITSSYERKIQGIITLAQETLERAEFSGLVLKTHVRHVCALKILATKDKKKRHIAKEGYINAVWDKIHAEHIIQRVFPQCYKVIKGDRTPETIKFAMGELKEEFQRSRERFSAIKRRAFRKAISLNHEAIREEFRMSKGRNLKLHDTRLDRVVLDAIHPELMTYRSEVKSTLKRNAAGRNERYTVSRIIPMSRIEALRKIETEFSEDVDIDAIVKQWEASRLEQLEQGYASKGKIIQKYPWGKVEFTYEPHSNGAPIRLRLITNVQNCIRQELCDMTPGKEEEYRRCSWNGDSEINFILPKDYQYYYDKEWITCDWLINKVKELFFQLISDFGMAVQKPDDLIIYASQFEICWEEPFTQNVAFKPFTSHNYPALVNYLWDSLSEKEGIGEYVVFKKENGRPSFYCDIASLDPVTPIMQYKIYPKFHIDGTTYIRHELTNTKFAKLIDASLDREGSGLSYWLLNDPKSARTIFEEIYWLETYNHRGDGYNRRFSQDTDKEALDLFKARQTARAVFNRKYLSRMGEIVQLNKTDRCPKTIKGRPREIMEELGIISKQSRGTYLATKLYHEYVHGQE